MTWIHRGIVDVGQGKDRALFLLYGVSAGSMSECLDCACLRFDEYPMLNASLMDCCYHVLCACLVLSPTKSILNFILTRLLPLIRAPFMERWESSYRDRDRVRRGNTRLRFEQFGRASRRSEIHALWDKVTSHKSQVFSEFFIKWLS